MAGQEKFWSVGTLRRYAVPLAWLALIVVYSLVLPNTFLTVGSFQAIFGSQSILLLLALALVVSLTVGEFDLSVAGVMSVSMVLVGLLHGTMGWPVLPAVLVALTVGAIIGLIHALLIIGVGVSSIVVTLGSGTLLTGVGIALNSRIVTDISRGLVDTFRTEILGLPLSFYYVVVLTIALWYVLSYTALGRYMYFVGSNKLVAQLAGIRVNAVRTGALVGTSLLSAAAGVMLTGNLGAADPNISSSFLLPAFAAAFLGSTTITPGRFNAWGTFIAVFFLTTGITGLELLGLGGWVTSVFYGGSLVIAVVIAQLGSGQTKLFRLRRPRVGRGGGRKQERTAPPSIADRDGTDADASVVATTV